MIMMCYTGGSPSWSATTRLWDTAWPRRQNSRPEYQTWRQRRAHQTSPARRKVNNNNLLKMNQSYTNTINIFIFLWNCYTIARINVFLWRCRRLSPCCTSAEGQVGNTPRCHDQPASHRNLPARPRAAGPAAQGRAGLPPPGRRLAFCIYRWLWAIDWISWPRTM